MVLTSKAAAKWTALEATRSSNLLFLGSFKEGTAKLAENAETYQASAVSANFAVSNWLMCYSSNATPL